MVLARLYILTAWVTFLIFVLGKQHVSYGGRAVAERVQVLVQCRCKCNTKFSPAELSKILEDFNALPDHNGQNIYLRGCISVTPDAQIRRRPRKDDAKKRTSYTYSITLPTRTEDVCKSAFCGTLGIKESRLKKKVLDFAVDIKDGRGNHGNHPKIAEDIRDKIRSHIRQFPARESHYSRSKNENKSYLDATLSIAEMHRLFIQDTPECNDVKYWLYHDIFNFEFNIAFGYPRSDICDKCEKFTADIKAAKAGGEPGKARELTAQHELHIRKADVFNFQMKEDSEAAKLAGNTDVICMDYEKNLPLPLTGIGQEYYKRQLWIHNLCIHSMVTDQPYMYLYAEHYAGKGPNDVISILDDYISKLPDNITKLTIFADNCFSQNKNRLVYVMTVLVTHISF